MVDIKKITTEKRNENTKNIDLLKTIDMLKLINKEDKKVALAIEKSLDQIALVVDQITEVFENGGRLVYLGAGTSGRIGVLDASECPPTFGVPESMVVGLIAGGDYALRHAVENIEDSREDAVKDLEAINFNENDILVGIAASGRTPYVLEGLKYANNLGARTSCITTSEDSPVAKKAKFPIEVITGPEVLTGSTRMKSGTAQKMVANMLTTTAMIKIGKVYENLMVDVQMTNQKLVSRAENIVMEVTDVDKETAKQYLKKYETVKLAIFAIMTGIEDHKELERILDENKGNIRKSIKNLESGKVNGGLNS